MRWSGRSGHLGVGQCWTVTYTQICAKRTLQVRKKHPHPHFNLLPRICFSKLLPSLASGSCTTSTAPALQAFARTKKRSREDLARPCKRHDMAVSTAQSGLPSTATDGTNTAPSFPLATVLVEDSFDRIVVGKCLSVASHFPATGPSIWNGTRTALKSRPWERTISKTSHYQVSAFSTTRQSKTGDMEKNWVSSASSFWGDF